MGYSVKIVVISVNVIVESTKMKIEKGVYRVKKEDFDSFVKDVDVSGIVDWKGRLYSERLAQIRKWCTSYNSITDYPFHETPSGTVLIHILSHTTDLSCFGWDLEGEIIEEDDINRIIDYAPTR